jgi:hypothetical protein
MNAMNTEPPVRSIDSASERRVVAPGAGLYSEVPRQASFAPTGVETNRPRRGRTARGDSLPEA